VTSRARPDGRIVFIDVARVLATLMMLLGHTVDALLGPAYRSGAAYTTWMFLRGLTPTTFMFVSGFALSLVALHVSRRESPGAAAARRLRRFGFFLLIGYAMHYPAANLAGLRMMTAADWRAFTAADVLHCIAVTLAVLQVMALRLVEPRRFLTGTALLATAIGLLTPIIWRTTPPLPVALTAYLNPSTGSIFPLFPWLANGAIGATIGAWYLLSPGATPGARARRTLLPVGLAMLAAALAMRAVPWEPFDAVNAGAARPSQLLMQAGLAASLLAVLASVVDLRPTRLPALEDFAQESLTIYVVHVCLVYGSPWNRGLRQWFGASLDPWRIGVAVLGLWTAMFLLALGWSRYKRRAPVLSRRIRFAVLGLMFVLLLV